MLHLAYVLAMRMNHQNLTWKQITKYEAGAVLPISKKTLEFLRTATPQQGAVFNTHINGERFEIRKVV